MRISRRNLQGSALVVVLLTVVILSLSAAAMLRMASARYRNTMQAATWQQSVYSAESGADIAIAAVAANSWTGWTDGSGAAVSSRPPASSNSPPAASDIRVLKGLLDYSGGQGGSQSALIVQVDAPFGLRDAYGQWYRIRSTGVAELPGTRNMGYEPALFFAGGARQSAKNKLRRFAFVSDSSSGLLSGRGQAARTIEVIVKPTTKPKYSRAFTVKKSIAMSGGGMIDSFDSSDSTKSTNGVYDIGKRQSNGDIGTTDSTGSDLKSTYVYGDLQYTGPAVANTTNVQGTITTPFNETIDPVAKPTWTTFNPTPTVINGSATITGGPATAPTRLKLTAMTVSGGNSVVINPHASGAESYVEIWITGKLTTSGSGFIEQAPGVHVTYYVEDDITVSGSSFNNKSNIASNLEIYGVSPASGTKTLTVSGSGTFVGVVDAPGYDFVVSGSANFSGAFIGSTVNISGGASVHYDEALLKQGSTSPGNYTVMSWVENVR